ncbi:ankyrin repeat domain-containing protein [Xanthocytophaga flava]|uniref:ankyrin repeat domain-containing protein n=1 Tax=Xanthocytophaga flava TaxID=3048013 RepID=UPI0028D311D7|nr:ankyrin repeat domain-containing protein [Xanthocytophaga flavus]MDJ1466975.1 SMI1/KNR4 family protein [Xanthocytophaga flavus]
MNTPLYHTEASLQAFIKLIGNELPEPYLNFLRSTDAELVEDEKTFVIKDKKGEMIDEVVLETIYRLGVDEYYLDLEGHYRMFEDRISDKMIPIAGDSFGNQFCLSIQKKTWGKVYFWYHELEGEPDALVLLAKDFNTFWKNLSDYQVEEEDPYLGLDEPTILVRKGDLELLKQFLEESGDINYRNVCNRSLLVEAVMFNKPEIARYLIEKGISMKLVLIYGAGYLDKELLLFMLAKGVDPNEVTEETQVTALMSAARAGNREMVHLLLAAGAKVDKENRALQWQSVINQAIWRNNKVCLAVLKEDFGFTDAELVVNMS